VLYGDKTVVDVTVIISLEHRSCTVSAFYTISQLFVTVVVVIQVVVVTEPGRYGCTLL